MTSGSKDIPIKVTILDSGWSIPIAGEKSNQLCYYGTSTGTVKTSTTAFSGCHNWEDYMMVGYVNLATVPTTSNNRVGFILRYQDSSNYYFVGFMVDKANGGGSHSSYEVWKKVSGSYSRVANQYSNGNNNEGTSNYSLPDGVGSSGVLSADTQYHVRVDMYERTCRFYISNVLVYQNTTDFTTFSHGEVGMEAYSASSAEVVAYFDNIRLAV